jgi:hypothetical protein
MWAGDGSDFPALGCDWLILQPAGRGPDRTAKFSQSAGLQDDCRFGQRKQIRALRTDLRSIALILPFANLLLSSCVCKGRALQVLVPSASLPPKNRLRDSLTLATFGDFANALCLGRLSRRRCLSPLERRKGWKAAQGGLSLGLNGEGREAETVSKAGEVAARSGTERSGVALNTGVSDSALLKMPLGFPFWVWGGQPHVLFWYPACRTL